MPPLSLRILHSWDVRPDEAVALQERLAPLVREVPLTLRPRTLGGVDVAFREATTRAAAVIVRADDLQLVHAATAEGTPSFPYVPGLLAFREIPAILKALEQLPFLPDVILCDGHGKAHPRRFGLACHLGVLLDHPTVGCAKRRLVGEHAAVPETRGAWVPLVDRGEVIGAVVRTRTGVRPVYVSVGHRITLEEAVHLVITTAPRFRLPEPLRLAHRLSTEPR